MGIIIINYHRTRFLQASKDRRLFWPVLEPKLIDQRTLHKSIMRRAIFQWNNCLFNFFLLEDLSGRFCCRTLEDDWI